MSSTAHQNRKSRPSKEAQKFAQRAVARALEQIPNGVLSGAPSKLTARIYEIVDLSAEYRHLLEHLGDSREERLALIEWAIRNLSRRRIIDFQVSPRVTFRRGSGKVRKNPSASLRLKTAQNRRLAVA